ncbi:MAG: lytic transglycosylase domain-containing protein [Kiloniellales bacterium]|nr:lytic transglycosylase domain-containing protein [Kiloniellales bacterium]
MRDGRTPAGLGVASQRSASAQRAPTAGTARDCRRCGVLRRGLGGLFALALAALPIDTARAGVTVDQGDEAWLLCAENADEIEKTRGLPPFLLTAIAKVESGRWHDLSGETLPWPWTVTSERGGRYLPSKEAAIREVRRLQDEGVVSIDVGCMQVNLLHHPDAFEDLEAAFDPVRNISYAASFLSDLQRRLRSWTRAIGRYHSATPEFSGSYRFKVLRAWRAERQRVWQVRRTQTSASPKT